MKRTLSQIFDDAFAVTATILMCLGLVFLVICEVIAVLIVVILLVLTCPIWGIPYAIYLVKKGKEK
jgi:ABC-type Fe3+-siderophore transport system permease subunit